MIDLLNTSNAVLLAAVVAIFVIKFVAIFCIVKWIFYGGIEPTLECIDDIRDFIRKEKDAYKLRHPEKYYMTNKEFERRLYTGR